MNQEPHKSSEASAGAGGGSFFADLKALPRPVWILCAGTFINRFGTFVVPFLALYMKQQGFSLGQTSLAMAAYGAGHFLASAIGGYLADRIGRRNTIVLSMVSVAVSILLLSQARQLEAIVLLAGLVGLTGECYRPAGTALLADLVPAGKRVPAYAAYRLAVNAGWAFGPATAGFLAERSFFWLFVMDAVTSLIYAVVAWAALPHGLRSGREGSQWSVAWRAARQDRRFLQVVVATFAVAFVFFQMSSTFSLHVTGLGYSAATYGLLVSMNGVLVVLFELPLTAWTQRWPTRSVMAVGFLLVGGGYAVNALGSSLPFLAGAILVFTLGEMISMPVTVAYVADLAPETLRGRYMGLFGFTWSLALTAGPSLGMLIFARSPQALWVGCGLLGVIAAGLILRKEKGGPG